MGGQTILKHVLVGSIYHSISVENLQYLPLVILGISEQGKIEVFKSLPSNCNINYELDLLFKEFQFDHNQVF